jgi:hypothetical protein
MSSQIRSDFLKKSAVFGPVFHFDSHLGLRVEWGYTVVRTVQGFSTIPPHDATCYILGYFIVDSTMLQHSSNRFEGPGLLATDPCSLNQFIRGVHAVSTRRPATAAVALLLIYQQDMGF